MYKTAHHTAHRSRRVIPGLLVAAIAVTSCVGDDASADDVQTCSVAQRLVDEIADGDIDGVERQLDRLSEVDDIGDRTDLDEIEDLAEIGDEDALEDLTDQVQDDFDCDLDVPRIVDVEAAPADTPVPPVDPVVTEPATTAPPTTAPPTTAPSTIPTTEAPPATTAPPATPAVEGQPLAVVEIGADAPVGLDMADIAEDPTVLIAEAGVLSLPIPAGEAIGIEYTIDYSINDFADSPEYSVRESATFVAATAQTIEQVRDAFSGAILDATGVDYDLSESSASRDETTQSSVDLRPDFGDDALSYEVVAASSDDAAGLVYIEVTASGNRAGALPAMPAAAAASLAPAFDIGGTLGWELAGWSWNPGFNQFNGEVLTSGRLEWAIGPGTAGDVATESAALLAVVPTPEFEDISDDREFYIVGDDENWTVRYSEAYEGAELRGGYSYTA